MKFTIFFALLFCVSKIATAQLHQTTQHKAQISLKIGDKIPDMVINNFIDHAHPAIKLSDLYKNGGLIINFWATWCKPCIQELPVLNTLAGKYQQKLSVLSVEYESSAIVTNFLSGHKELNLSNLNIIAGDTVLIEYLKHRGLPFNVWIDNKGIIRHFTDSEDINEANVIDFLNNRMNEAHEVKEVLNWDFNKPFHLRDSSYEYRSIFTDHTDGILSGFMYYTIQKPKVRMINRIFVFNQTISRLYRLAYLKMPTEDADDDYFNLVEFQIADSLKYFAPKANTNDLKKSKYKTEYEWEKENCYCYELTLPEPVKDSVAFDYMFNDLQRKFHLNANIVNEKRLCTIVTLPEKSKRKLFKPSDKDSSFYRIDSIGIVAECITLKKLLEKLNSDIRPNLNAIPTDHPYINETGIEYPIDLNLKFTNKKITFQDVKKILETKYGLQFKLEERNYPVLVIKESDIK